jgi:hypothetical protein
MALVLQDRVSVNSTGSGTGSLVLGSAYPGFRTFASCIPTGSIVYYTITNQSVGFDTEWEVGYGTYTLSTNTLSRDVVYSSSNADALVNFTAGANGLQVFITYPSEQAVFQQPDGVTEFNEGPISVVGANATPGTFSATLGQFTSNEPGFSQLYIENQSNDSNASSDIVAYNNLGDGTNYFVDMGMASSTYNDAVYPIFQANDAYLYNAGNTAGTGAAGDISRLLIGTSTANSNVVIFGGSVNVNAVITTFVASTKNVNFANNISVTSNVSANNVNITNLAYSGGNINAAANTTVLTTKAYVDGAVATGFIVHDAAVYATAAALPNSPTYNNGTSGVGATLTANTNAALVIDGVTLVSPTDNGIRVLIKNEVASQYNGIYVVTESGSGGAPWVLTRATDFDTYAAGNIATNAYVYVTSGNTNIGSSWIFSQIGTVVVGTTPLHFELFSQPAAYTGTAPINVSGQIISLTGIVPVANGGTNLSSYTTGDTLYANATNTLTRRPIGSANTVLVSNGSVPDWGTVALGSSNAVSGTLGPTNGGTGQNSYVLGDIVYANGTNTLAKLAGQITTTQKFLSQTGTGAASAAPVWDTIPAGSITGLGTMSTQNANAVAITGGAINGTLIGNASPTTATFTTATATLFAGSGANLTSLNGSNVSSGTIDNARTTAATANGASTIVLRDAGGNFAANTITANLTGTASSATSATSATTATNIAGGAAGSIPYQSGSGTTQLLATGTGVLVGGTTPAYTTTPTLTGTNFSGIPNSATTASSANGASTIVSRDASGNFSANTITANLTGTASTATNQSGGTVAATTGSFSGTITSSGGSNSISLTNGTNNWIYWGPSGFAAPSFTTRSNGTKLVLYPAVTGSAVDYAMGIDSGILWTSVPDGSQIFRWYAGTTVIGTLTGGGAFSVSGSCTASSFSGAGTGLTGTASSLSIGGTATTATTANALNTGNNYQINSLGVGTAGSGTAGEIRATNNITAYYSDDRMKTNLGNIPDALAKLKTLNGFYYEANDVAQAMGYEAKKEVGVSAQQVQAVMPEVVAPAPIDDKYLTVRYERLVPLLIEAIKELEAQVAELKAR